jgi:hypothetical protein
MGGDLTVAKSADGLEFTLAMPAVAVPA